MRRRRRGAAGGQALRVRAASQRVQAVGRRRRVAVPERRVLARARRVRVPARLRTRMAVRVAHRAQSSAFCQGAMTLYPNFIIFAHAAGQGMRGVRTEAGAGSDAAAGRNVATMRCRSASTLSHSPWS